ncbi:MAG: phosphoribosyltransferase [Flavobacteriales bacterium]|nr:phosphoribosyltransferase [Flavobacteriales bacterium]
MQENRTILLDHNQIERKIQRMAWQLFENNHLAKKMVLIGIADNGMYIVERLCDILSKISNIELSKGRIDLDKKLGFDSEVSLQSEVSLEGETVVVVDDVLNSGKTMFASLMPVIQQKPSKIQTAVLADRNHKTFPVKGDVVGISLATTLQEHIWFNFSDKNDSYIYLT